MDLSTVLTGPLPFVAGVAAAGGGVFWLDARLRNGPRARLEARLTAMLARGDRAANERGAADEAAVFLSRKGGLRGALANWLGTVSANIGGRKAVRTLFALTGAAGVALWLAARLGAGMSPLLALGVALGGAVAVFLVAQGEMRRRWMIAFLDQLVEALELLTRSVRAGYAVPAAIRMVGKEVGAPVGDVFRQIADEDDLGIEMRDALRNAARRVNLADFTFLAVALIIQRETGGQIGDSLDNLHGVLRKRKEARLKVQALTAEGRMSAIIVGAIPFVAGGGVYLMNPEQTMRLFEPGAGQTMLGTVGGLMLIGMLIMRWMVKARP